MRDDHRASNLVTRTFLFTDVEGSTRFRIEEPARADGAFARHDEIITEAVTSEGGVVVKGMGDGFLASFESARAGLDATLAAQRVLYGERGSLSAAGLVRMALHSGEAEQRGSDFFGLTLNRCSRLVDAAHGGQILMSQATRELLDELPANVTLVDLGERRLRDLVEPMRIYQANHPDLQVEFPPLRTLDRFRHNFPTMLTNFIGRHDELRSLTGLLADNRLLTLGGIGGVGKTRLALQAAAEGLDAYPEGAFLVELGAVRDPDLVVQQAAASLRLAEQPGRPAIERLISFLARRTSLLILDNCEHVREPAARMIERLLLECPSLSVMATSRERLGVPGEVWFVVPPMSTPDVADDADAVAVAATDAAQLFAQRAALARPGFWVTPENAAAVARICRQLDGLPLALELAAARVAALSPQAIADRLGHRFSLLKGSDTLPPRHQTLRAAIEWSYDLLHPEERRLLARLSVFRGGFDLPAAEAVCAEEEREAEDSLDLLIRLADQSLVLPGEDRYRLLETVREFAREMLEAFGDGVALERKHASYFATLAEGARPALLGADQFVWLNRLDVEHDNLRAAMRRSLDAGLPGTAMRIAASIWPFWKLRGYLAEGRLWLDEMTALAGHEDPHLPAEALLGVGDLATDQGDLAQAQEYLERAESLARGTDDEPVLAAVLAKQASIFHKQGEIAGAVERSEEALRLARRVGNLWVAGRVLAGLSLLYQDQGDPKRAASLSREALDTARRSGNPYLLTDALLSVGEIALNRSDLEGARSLFAEALDLAQTNELQDVKAWALAYAGTADGLAGQLAAGTALLEESLQQFGELDSPMGSCWALRHLGWIQSKAGDYSDAHRHLVESLRLAAEYVVPDAPLVLYGLGGLLARSGNPRGAAVLLGAARNLQDQMGLHPPPHELTAAEEAWRAVRRELDPEAIGELVAEGAALSPADATGFALGEPITVPND